MSTKILIAIAISLSLPTVSWANYYVGVWNSDITPSVSEASESCLGGYGQPFERCGYMEVRDKITVRSLFIADEDTRTHLAVIDAVGVGDSLISDIKDVVNTLSLGQINMADIQIIASHTHSGPDLQGLWGGVSDDYRNKVVIKTAISILLSSLFSFEADAYAFRSVAEVNNRRGWDSVEDSVNVLEFKHKGSNRRIATLVNMSAHPTILDASNTAYSADYVHFLRKEVEHSLHTRAVFINGVLGDAEPNAGDQRTYQAAREFGINTAQRLVADSEKATRVRGDFQITSFGLSHPVTNEGVIAAVAAGLLDLDLDENYYIHPEFSFFSFGDDVSGMYFPGEALTRLYAPLKDAMPTKYQFFFGLTGRSLGYFIPSDEYLQIEGRTTEERACLDPYIGDESVELILNNLPMQQQTGTL